MIDQRAHPPAGIGHPAPGRHRVGDWLLVFSFLLVPVAWSVQLVAISSLAGLACMGAVDDMVGSGGMPGPGGLAWAGAAIMWINIGALALGLVGIGLSLLNMQRSRAAADTPPSGVVEAGEGRVHWMAFGGLFVAVVTMIAIVANSVSVFWGGLCPG